MGGGLRTHTKPPSLNRSKLFLFRQNKKTKKSSNCPSAYKTRFSHDFLGSHHPWSGDIGGIVHAERLGFFGKVGQLLISRTKSA